jgi:hypothetical protein
MDRAQVVPRGMILGGTDLPQCLDRGLRPACVRLSSPTFGQFKPAQQHAFYLGQLAYA